MLYTSMWTHTELSNDINNARGKKSRFYIVELFNIKAVLKSIWPPNQHFVFFTISADLLVW
jgi:hypothetical protein